MSDKKKPEPKPKVDGKDLPPVIGSGAVVIDIGSITITPKPKPPT